ncbi:MULTISPECIES: class I SAM-dependent methyltransferase [unclassified Mesorhizobium]|uniref:class I SAM-dependent methyltransferase n=1 Tax=unclassified Mesorhizobium TaxID=325217 RepID=UPI000FE7652D|nr:MULTISPECIES: methyltransferase domain-containing protein [unclassified Mesorhizobium]RWI27802.1 MAG: methyltransferase domain-containing protein [Mesorhizobium sp.]RWK49444.1 MAG: methyltransferase domain-containing protein [Mesorhizobium sp.]RWK94810.1 MAG: methyltransferase domain-containing protein [Mesorhizobium sp.]RWL08479.1 MAG: methyltransferase domain-containing protein [Mesorhizobium sp.]TIP59205.1 MAG: methyltransferase domain-containing protein [Mesorhizobium sp.]
MAATATLPSYAMGQESFPEMYERWLVGPLFRPWAEVTFDEVKLTPGHRVLDIACGTGIVARVARERLGAAGYVAGIDISPDMLAVARSVAPDIDWREGNASALPLADGEQFDVVVCQQGLQFFPDKQAAVAEMRRALAQGGRLAVATWRSDEEIPFFRELRRVAERHLGPVADQRYGYGEADPLEALLRDAGFSDVRSKKLSRTIRFEESEPFLRLNTMALVGMSAAGKTMDDQERKRVIEAIVNDSAAVARSYSDGPGLAFELSTNLATAKG